MLIEIVRHLFLLPMKYNRIGEGNREWERARDRERKAKCTRKCDLLMFFVNEKRKTALNSVEWFSLER